MKYLYIVTLSALLLSLLKDRGKTRKALKIAYTRFVKILSPFLLMLVLVSMALTLIPDRLIMKLLGVQDHFLGMAIATVLGSVTLMPGFIAFPLCGILLKKGVPYMVLSAFSTSLMMVGVLTYPLEKAYFGSRVTIVRNLISLIIAIIVAIATGFFFGEIRL